MKDKKILGQYFTKTNPFDFDLFKTWLLKIRVEYSLEEFNELTFLEPFAGSNNIVRMIKEIGLENDWACFDIDNSKENVTPEHIIVEKDTISSFPTGYDVCITNPPYLAKVSASRLKLPYPDTKYEDIYMLCLECMLSNCKYVAAIIPESFITSGLFTDRLYGVISLNVKMFDDTECPVCLALFVPSKNGNNFRLYVGNKYLGDYDHLKSFDLSEYINYYEGWKFNDQQGEIGMKCVDNQQTDDIYFHEGELIEPSRIKISSRSFTRITGLPKGIDRQTFINEANNIINEYREKTKDVFLTSFKGLRKDGVYRRRIDFKTVRCIMNKALEIIRQS